MARNIEIKARISQPEELQRNIERLDLAAPTLLTQHDIFYSSERGRLKLRIFSAQSGELIFYRRADQLGPKESFYQMSKTQEPHDLAEVLALAYPIVGEVKKQRTLYLIGRTRLHLDQVEGLGLFMELEVVLAEKESQAVGMQIAADLMRELGIQQCDLIDRAYVDLLRDQQSAAHKEIAYVG